MTLAAAAATCAFLLAAAGTHGVNAAQASKLSQMLTRRAQYAAGDPATLCSTSHTPDNIDWTYNPVCYGGEYEVVAPDDWHTHPKYAACAGQRQSPINIVKSAVQQYGGYSQMGHGSGSEMGGAPAASAMWEMEGGSCSFSSLTPDIAHSVELGYEGCAVAPTLKLHEGEAVSTYKLNQLHLHAHAEHAIDGYLGDAELHLVHANEDDETDLLVIAVILEVAPDASANVEVYKYWSIMNEAVAEAKGSTPAAPSGDHSAIADAYKLLPGDKQYYSYEGSLTAPPCSETVMWKVMSTPVKVSQEQLNAFLGSLRAILGPILDEDGSTARPLQPINGRTVQSGAFA